MNVTRTALPALLLTSLCACVSAQETEPSPPPVSRPSAPNGKAAVPNGKTAVPLNKEGTVLLDAKARKLIVKCEIALREGLLEMLLCKRHTKEHESILAFDGKAAVLHAGLVALGIDPGKPVSFNPKYVAPQGTKLQIDVVWNDEKGKEQRADARRWIRHSIHRFFGEPLDALPKGLVIPEDTELRYDNINKELSWYGPMTEADQKKLLALSDDEAYQAAIKSFFKRSQPRQMDADWVFAGSGFVQDETSGQKIYLAESGDVICVANFPSAMIDVAVRSSAEGQETLMFEAWTERLPPAGTAVRLEITPVAKKADQSKSKPDANHVGNQELDKDK